jgi:hypothetical protein
VNPAAAGDLAVVPLVARTRPSVGGGIWPWQDLYAEALVADDHVAEVTEH